MSPDKKATLVFIPFPVVSHLVAAVKIANLLADRDPRLSITLLIMKLQTDTKISSYAKNTGGSRVNFIELPENEPSKLKRDSKDFILRFVDSQVDLVRRAVAKILSDSNSGRLAGFVLDMFCSTMMDVAHEFGVPSYLCFTSSSASIGLIWHVQSLRDHHGWDLKEFDRPEVEISAPTFLNPVPSRNCPPSMFDKDGDEFLSHLGKFRATKGVIFNTFFELETHAITSLSDDEKLPPVFPVGPILQSGGDGSDEIQEKHVEIIRWLDEQPDSSVVFLCFGSKGSFEVDQVREIARALENSGHRFLWSLRKPPPKERVEFPGEYENPGEVLPEGFLERTAGTGMVIGWAPQMAVLSHRAVGGFVSHCGWNSVLESVWCGVPMAVWPLAAEQQTNAFQLVKEFEAAVEIKMDYRMNSAVLVAADTIEKAIRRMMQPENKTRDKMRALREKSRKVLIEGGSSYKYLGRLIDTVMDNIS